MNLDDLRSVQSKERQKDSLQHLRDSFYEDVGEYVAELKDERDRAAERADDPFSSEEVGRLTDEIETAEEVVEAIYERRMGKLVKRASLAAAGMPSDEEGLTAEEQDLFEDLVDRIESNKAHVLDVLSGEVGGSAGDADSAASGAENLSTEAGTERDDADAGASPPSSGQTDPAAPDAEPPPVDGDPPPVDADRDDGSDSSADRPSGEASSVSAADLMGGGGAESDAGGSPGPDPAADDGDAASGDAEHDAAPSGSAAPADDGSGGDGAGGPGDSPDAEPDALDEDRTTVRITQDVGEILGVDEREYELSAEDVVTLPTTNAEPLIEREAAERLD